MRKDEDFKPFTMPDGSTIYSNLEKVCEGLPEWGNIYCSKCGQEIEHDPHDPNILFHKYKMGEEIWYRFFHGLCQKPIIKPEFEIHETKDGKIFGIKNIRQEFDGKKVIFKADISGDEESAKVYLEDLGESLVDSVTNKQQLVKSVE